MGSVADGPGAGAGILSITVDGHLYAYNAGTNAITKDGNPFAGRTGTLDLATTLGGHLTFHFTSGGWLRWRATGIPGHRITSLTILSRRSTMLSPMVMGIRPEQTSVSPSPPTMRRMQT
jgi:hypothetical protein